MPRRTRDSMLRKDDATAAHGVKLQHRHFAFIASVIAKLPTEYRDEVAHEFEKAIMDTNEKFDAIRFQLACRAWD